MTKIIESETFNTKQQTKWKDKTKSEKDVIDKRRNREDLQTNIVSNKSFSEKINQNRKTKERKKIYFGKRKKKHAPNCLIKL